MMDESTKLRVSALFASMGHPTRISIVEMLDRQAMSVGEISAALNLAQSSTSQHLAALLRAGVLDVTPRGTSRLYRVRGPRIMRMLNLIHEFCEVQGLRGEPQDEEREF